jgi:hypothetical protein
MSGWVLGCTGDGDDDPTGVAQTGSMEAGDDDDDDGSSSNVTGTDGTTGDDTGTGSDDGSDDMIDPTEGEIGPEFSCPEPVNGEYPESAVYDGFIIISPTHPEAVPVETLDGIAVITRDLIIDKTNYFDLRFLKCLVEVRGDVQIFGNYFLNDLTGLDNLQRIGRLPAPNPTPTDPNAVDAGKGTVTISENESLVDINGFNGIGQLGEQDPVDSSIISQQSLIIRNNASLKEINGFDELALIYASLVIQENPVLEHIDGLKSLQGIGGAFSVTRNESLCISSVICVGNGLSFGPGPNSTQSQNNDGC